jgi:hypothetical protein
MGVSDLRDAVGGDRKSLTRQLTKFRDGELVDYVELGPSAPGNPAGLWSLTDKGREAFGLGTQSPSAGSDAAQGDEGIDATDGGSDPSVRFRDGLLRAGQTWVSADVGGVTRATLRALLSDGELTAAASWVARLDGDGSTLLFAFEQELADQPADNLIAALEEIGASCTPAAIRRVTSPRDYIDGLRTAEIARTRAAETKAAGNDPAE